MRVVHIIVVGAGEVGSYVAERLSREGHDVVVIERDADRRRQIDAELDVLTIQGSGTHPRVLVQAQADRADMIVAVTSDDSANLLSSLAAKQLGVERSVVRIEAGELRSREAGGLLDAAGVDLVIDPDEETAHEILELLEHPGASEVAQMGGGEVEVIGARLAEDAPLVGKTLSEIAAEYEPEWEFLVGAISRGDETIIPRGDQRLEARDHLRIVCKRRSRQLTAELLGLARDLPRRVLLLGGGRTAEVLAGRLSRRGAHVVLVERDRHRARQLAERLDRTMVLEGEITDSDLLDEAGIGDFDAVVALTGEDDANILACLYAKDAGAAETIAVVHRLSLLHMLGEAGIDAALSPRTACANGVLRFVRGNVHAVATFLQGEAEVLELTVTENSPADGQLVAELGLPKDVLIGAIVRDGKAQIARGRSRLRDRDHVVVFAMPHAADEAQRVFGC